MSGFWLTFGLKHLKRIQGTLLAKPDISGFDNDTSGSPNEGPLL